ncbi:MAG TPA: TolC family outer membrane protein [Magnetococcales bacterium]|nr:TolC family outer membrane protein [Magnetococcales bacterium]
MLLSFATELKAQTLEDAVNQAIASHPKILAAMNDHLAWNQRINQAYADFLPKVDVRMGTGREWTSSPSTRAQEGGYALDRGEFGLSVNQSLFDGFNSINRVKQAKAQAKSAEAGLREAIDKIMLDAVDVYLETLKQGERLRIDDEAVLVHEQIVEKMEALARIGVNTDIEANQSRSRLVLAKSDRTQTMKKLREAEARYAEVVGSTPVRLTVPRLSQGLLPKSLGEALHQALHRAPALQASEADFDAKEAEKKMALSSLMPKVNLELGLIDNANVSGTRSYTQGASAMVKLEYNLFRGGSDWARTRETSRRMYQSQEDVEQARRKIIKDITTAWHGVTGAAEQVQWMEHHLTVQDRVATAYQEEQVLGTRSHLDALNALSDVFTAKRNLVDEKFKQMLAICDLLAGVGTLPETLTQWGSPSFQSATGGQTKPDHSPAPATALENEVDLTTLVFPALMAATVTSDTHKATATEVPDPTIDKDGTTDKTWTHPAQESLLDYVGTLENAEENRGIPPLEHPGG